MAGVEGFEPPNGGIKTRCLTTWRHPSRLHNPSYRHIEHRMQRRAVQAPRHKTAPTIRNSRRDALGILRALKAGEYACARARHTRMLPSIARANVRLEPIQRCSYFRITITRDRLADIAGLTRREGAYCDERRISCQFRGLEDLSRADGAARMHDHKPALRQAHRLQPLPTALAPGRGAAHEQRHIGPKAQPDLRE